MNETSVVCWARSVCWARLPAPPLPNAGILEDLSPFSRYGNECL